MIDTIAFDADDTLWQSETIYREVEKQFLGILARYGISHEQVLPVFHRIEIDNLPYFGYGIRGFILSMVEAAVHVTGGKINGTDVQTIIELGREMTSAPIVLLDGVEETLAQLQDYRLLLITKGDALDQESKIQRSGLLGYFSHVEIVVDKTLSAYRNLLTRQTIDPDRFLMVGNSLRSDIAPVLSLGGYAVYVPSPLSWDHESTADLPEDRTRFFEIPNLSLLSDLIRQIDRG